MQHHLAWHSTTILAVKKDDRIAIAADGQVTLGETVVKHHAQKIRKLADGKVVVGFAGAAADAFTLLDRFESKITEYHQNIRRAAVELAKDWRTDRMLRRLEAMLVVAGKVTEPDLLVISGNGEIIEPDDGIVAIGSGGAYALAAARALLKYTNLSAKEIAVEALNIAGNICVYTNTKITVEEI
ncbi:MAG: ATP-dependent protease subunit HslV [bacterium]|nr:ATP-dependent protease subunit HslV [bacterium]